MDGGGTIPGKESVDCVWNKQSRVVSGATTEAIHTHPALRYLLTSMSGPPYRVRVSIILKSFNPCANNKYG